MTSKYKCDGMRALANLARFANAWDQQGAAKKVCTVAIKWSSDGRNPVAIDLELIDNTFALSANEDILYLRRQHKNEITYYWRDVVYPLPVNHMPVIHDALYGDRAAIHTVDFGDGWGMVEMPALFALWVINSVLKGRSSGNNDHG